jgi:hypothetical protein
MGHKAAGDPGPRAALAQALPIIVDNFRDVIRPVQIASAHVDIRESVSVPSIEAHRLTSARISWFLEKPKII